MELRVLGPLQVVVDGVALPLGGPKQRAVLAVLVQGANTVVSADALVDTVWGDDPPPSAVGIVRTYVSRLRRLLAGTGGIELVGRAPGYVLEVPPERIDAHRFEQLVDEARAALRGGRPGPAATTLDGALGLWRGDVLADLAGVERLRPTVTRLEQLRLAALEDRNDARLALGRHAEIVGELEALVGRHPLRERLWRQLITALYRADRQADALAAYRALRTTLAEEMGLEPSPDLQALERAVLTQDDSLRWRPAGSGGGAGGSPAEGGAESEPSADHRPPRLPSATPPGPPLRLPLPPGVASSAHHRPFVGRDHELALLTRSLDAARTGHFATVVVSGPPGIGKSALAHRFACDAHAAGANVVVGRADDGGGVPFQPLDEAVRHWALHAPPADVERLGDVAAAALSRLADLGGGPGRAPVDPGPNPGPGGAADRQRLFEAVGRWIEVLAADRPALVLLDDLHWADPATLLAVRHLVRHPPAAGAVLLVNHRPPGPDQPELAEALAVIRTAGHASRVELAGLTEAELRELVPRTPGAERWPAPGRLAAQLRRRTGGNPLFVHETLRHLAERSVPGDDDQPHARPAAEAGDGDGGELSLAALGVPSGVTDMIEHRLRGLPTATVTVIRPAAVLGHELDVAVLGRVVEMPELAVVEALEPAVAAGLLDQDGDRADRFAFSHALVRDAILGGLAPSKRIRAHWRAGEALAALAGPRSTARLGEIAHHLAAGARAGDARAAVAANVRAGRHALAGLAFEDARALFTTAVDLVETTGADDPDLAYEAWLGLGHAAATLADVERQRDAYLHAAAIARDQGWPRRVARVAVGFALYAATADSGSRDQLAARELLREARRGVADRPSVEHCVLLALETMNAVIADRAADARRHAATARDLARSLDDPTAEVGALVARCWSLVGTPSSDELGAAAGAALGQPAIPEARILAQELTAPLLALPALQRGDGLAFAAVRDRVAGDAARGSVHVPGYVQAWDGATALCRGRLDEALRLAMSLPRVAGGPLWEIVSQLQICMIWIERGDPATIAALLAQHLGAAPDAVGARAIRALLLARAGDEALAAQEVATLRDHRALDELGWHAPLVLGLLAEVVVRLGDRDLATDLLDVLSGYAGQLLVAYSGITIAGAADRAIGQLLLATGRTDDAVERLTAAHALEERFEATLLATTTATWLARAHLHRAAAGDHEAARHLLHVATHTARRIGATQLLHEIATTNPDPPSP